MSEAAFLPDIGTLSPRVRKEGTLLPPMTSYAQNFEDVLLRRSLQDITAGFYVDIGAYHPEFHSVTKSFYDSGWSGINVEPHPGLFQRLAAARPSDVNLNCAVGCESGRAPFTLIGHTGLSALQPIDLAPFGRLPVRVVDMSILSLDEILRTHAVGRTIDFLKIDVEGSEAAVLRGARLDRNRPRIIVVEATQPMSQEPAWQEWEPLLLEAGYHFAWFDGLNRFYVQDRDRPRLDYFRLPPCCFDNFLVAVAGPTEWMFEMPAILADLPSDSRQPPAPGTGLEVQVPVSLGELIDKISILEIKSERIAQPARLANVRHELGLLQAELARALSPMPEEIAALAAALKCVNELIWDAEDVIHGPDAATLPEPVFLQQAHITFDHTDVRARLKRRINDLSGSTIVEEKSYPDFGGSGP
ncbi:MAG: FkbM family methyltransferase [Methylovirgula sp.]